MAIFASLPRIARPLASLGLLLASGLSAVAAQVNQPHSQQPRVTLRGNVRPIPARARDVGGVDINLPSGRLQLLLKRPAAQESALAQFLKDVHTPGSAMYHQWMTPAQFGARFGPAEADVQAAAAWLQSQGFAVAKVNQARTAIEFSGTMGQIQRSFATQLHTYNMDGETHISNIADPQIPASLSAVVAGISPLNDFRLKPMHSLPTAHLAEPAPTSANPRAMTVRPAPGVVQPDLTLPGSNGGPEQFYVTPSDLATIYNIPNSTLNRHYAASASLDGTGVSVGIAGVSNVDVANVANYRALLGLPSAAVAVTIDGNDPGVQGDSAVEALLDLEQVSAVAPNAALTLYIAQDTTLQQGLFLAIQRALDENAVGILNVSFGGCEAYQTVAGNQQVLNFWQQAAAQGISVTVSTGDSSAAGCDDAGATAAAQGLQVNALASTPYNIAVGGTDFNETTANSTQFWSSTNSSIFESANGPIPEIPWNNSTTTIGGLAGNVAFTDSKGSTRIDGAGGGVSGCLNATVDNRGNVISCTGGYPAPGFQSGFGHSTTRQLPDVSMFAANGGHQAAYLLCASGLGGDQPTDVDCSPSSPGAGFPFQAVGGTSASSPVFAGVLALVSQSLGAHRLGQADFTLYPLSTQHANAFHDVTTGNISPVCTAGSPNCGANHFLTGYDAGTGYDLATGLGSVDVTQLVQNWGGITFKPSATALQLNGSTSPIHITHGTAVSVSSAVTGSGATPTGNVALMGSNGAVGTTAEAVLGSAASPLIFQLNNGTASGSYGFLPGGTYTVMASYEGNGTFAPSVSAPISVTVSPEASTLQLAIRDFPTASSNGSASNGNGGTFPYGSYISVAATPLATATHTGTALATGSITFTSSSQLLAQSDKINSDGFAEITNQTSLAYPPGAYSVSASYTGDASFSASTAAAQSFTITKADTSLSAGGSTTGTGALVLEVDPNNPTFFVTGGASQPTGSVTVTNSAGATVGTATLAAVTLSDGSTAAQAAITLNTASLTIGANALNASYPGDGNYNATGPASFTYTLTGTGGGAAPFAVSAAPASLTVPRGGAGTTTVSITPQSGFSGTVNLTCQVSGGTTLPPTCSLAQPSVTLTSGAASDVLTVATQGSAALHIPAAPAGSPWYTAGGATLASLLLLGLPGRRRAWQRMLSLLLVVVAIGFAGCGGSSSPRSTPSGSYTVTVTATSGSTTQTSTVNVTVQ